MKEQEKKIGKAKLLGIVHDIAAVAAKSFNLNIWGIELLGSGTRPVVRIFVDTPWEDKVIPFVKPLTREEKSRQKSVHPMTKKDDLPEDESFAEEENFSEESGVSVDDCAEISRLIGLSLEVEDIFADAWILEVSSPGLERSFYEIGQLRPYLGHPVDVTLELQHKDFADRKKFRGTLKEVNANTFTLILDNPEEQECEITWDSVKKAHLIHIFPETTLTKTNSRK